MKAVIAITLLAIISTSHSLPLASSSPEEAQSVIPLSDQPLPLDKPASDIPVAKIELKPQENIPTAVEPKEEIKEIKPVESELKSIEEKSIIIASGVEEPKEVVAVVAAENSGIKEEETILNVARSAEPEVAAAVDELAPVVPSKIESEKPIEAEATKGLLSSISEIRIDEVVQPAEKEAEPILGKDLPTELKSAILAVEPEVTADIRDHEIKEEKVISEQLSKKSEDQVVEAIDKVVSNAEEIPIENKEKSVEVSEVVLSQTELRSAAVGETEIEQPKEEKAKESEKEVKKLDEDEEYTKKEEYPEKDEKNNEESKKEEESPEEIKKPIKPEEQPKKPEDVKETSDESSEEDNSSQEKKDKYPLNKTGEDQSSEESDEKKSS